MNKKNKNKITNERMDFMDMIEFCHENINLSQKIELADLIKEEISKDEKIYDIEVGIEFDRDRILDKIDELKNSKHPDKIQISIFEKEVCTYNIELDKLKLERKVKKSNILELKELSNDINDVEEFSEMMKEYYKIQQIISEEHNLEQKIRTSDYSSLEGIENRLSQLNTNFIASGMKQQQIGSFKEVNNNFKSTKNNSVKKNKNEFIAGIKAVKSFTKRIASGLIDEVYDKFNEISNIEKNLTNKSNIIKQKSIDKKDRKNYDPHMDVPEIDYKL